MSPLFFADTTVLVNFAHVERWDLLELRSWRTEGGERPHPRARPYFAALGELDRPDDGPGH